MPLAGQTSPSPLIEDRFMSKSLLDTPSFDPQTAKPTAVVKARMATLPTIGILYLMTAIAAAIVTTATFSNTALAAPAAVSAAAPALSAPSDFQKKSYALSGSVRVETRGDQTVLVFSDDFKTRSGPDLKVFLSPRDVAGSTGANATSGAVRLGRLHSTRGTQDYVLPEGIILSDYESVLVHCEAFSKLWGGADLSE